MIEAARSEVKRAKTIAKSNYSFKLEVVVNCFPENEDVLNRSKLVSGNFPIQMLWNSRRNCEIVKFRQAEPYITTFGDETWTYFVEYTFMNLIMKSKTAIQNSRLFPVQTLTLCLPIPRTWQLWVTVLHFRVDDRKYVVNQIQLKI